MVWSGTSTCHWQNSPITTATKRASRCHISKPFMNDLDGQHWVGLSQVKGALTLWRRQKRRWSKSMPTYLLSNLIRWATPTRGATPSSFPTKGVCRFDIKGKLAPRYIGPYPIINKYGPLSYQVGLSSKLSGVHNVFYVSKLKRCLKPPTDVVVEDAIPLEPDLTYKAHPIKIFDQ
jgi:hypothetical protein